VPLWAEQQRLQGEKETLGFYLSGHPLHRYLKELHHFITCKLAELHPTQHQTARVAGIITNLRTRQTKRGDRIGIVTLDDGTAQIETVCFSDTFHKYRHVLSKDQLVVIEGDVSLDDFNQSVRIIGRDIYTIQQARERFSKYLQIKLKTLQTLDTQQFKQLIEPHRGGNCPITLRYLVDGTQTDIRLGKSWLVQPVDQLLTMLQEQLHADEVEMVY